MEASHEVYKESKSAWQNCAQKGDDMSSVRPFRGFIDKEGRYSFIEDLQGKLKPILDFEKSHRKSLLIEIRNNYIDLYFLGHAVKVEQKKFGYNISSAVAFRPDRIDSWPISFDDVKELYKDYDRKKYKSELDEFMSEIIFKIVRHKEGDISEGVSEMNHYIDNRVASNRGDVLVIDRQVTYEGARIDLLGLKKSSNGKYAFVIIELKNRENPEINSVFTQTKDYIDILWNHYDDFQATYSLILEQKIELGLLVNKNSSGIVDRPANKKEIEGIVVLDNYNLRSSRLKSALDDWSKIHSSYNIKLFFKTNTFNDNLFWNYSEASKIKI